MKFHEYTTMFDASRRAGLAGYRVGDHAAAWYARTIGGMEDDARKGIHYGGHHKAAWILAHQARSEADWLAEKRPYYSVYPLVAGSLIRLPLDLDCGLIRLPLPVLFVRFAVGHELRVPGGRQARSIFASFKDAAQGPTLVVWIDFGESMPMGGMSASPWPIYSYRSFRLLPGTTLEAALAQKDYVETDTAAQESDEDILPCIRLICTLCLLGNDPDMITPDVLADDRQKFADSGDQKYIDKAVRRGKRGWLIGAKVEIDPHYRRPHFALRWTGEGRKIPKIVPVKGSVVHRQKLSEVPTGFMDEEKQKPSSLAKQAASMEETLNERSDQ